MAEFKLGRLKFVWKGDWVTGTVYVKDDVVKYTSKTYICVVGHTAAADFNTDLNVVPAKWEVVSDGQRWRSDWATTTAYDEGDLVKYGGNVYLCTNAHTSAATSSSGLEANTSDWTTFAEGFDWKGDWSVSTRYKINDVVQYGATNYICNTYHTSAATASLGLENNIAYWDEFSSGVDYKGLWVTATRYKVNDVVKYGAGLWVCTTQHTAGATFSGDSANWSQFVEGIEYESTWSSATAYQPGDVVKYGGNLYVAKTQHTNSNPVTGAANWDLFAEGFSYQSDWSISTSYKIGEIVKLNGYTYLAVADSPSSTQTVTATNNGTTYFTCSDTSSMVANMAISFTGTTFGNVFTSGTYYIKQIVSGTTFTISTTVGGTAFTPTTATGSMTATFAIKPPNASYWSVLTNGLNWRGTWSDDTEYLLGDLVKYGSNVYICKLAHRSEGDDGSTVGATGGGQANSRPDIDATTSTYWSVFTLGDENSVMTTIGDLVYYDVGGPTRLPIGIEGQVLRVSSDNIPEWTTWGSVDHVYYVAPNGEDRPYPICGATLDKPWKTIRYAAMQVEKGCRNPNAQYLLEMNRVFIQREVGEWINEQITGNIAPFTTSFTYAQDKCERDIGWVIDALIYDIGHGGNVRTRGAALAYVNALTEDEQAGAGGTYTQLAAESAEDVAAYNYMLEVITAVLANEAPAVLYQVVAQDSTAITAQYINTDYVAETGVLADITDLVDIITTALEDQNDTNIPERYAPHNTINIKTGRYRETLPIIVPESTVMLGDEVRSTNAGPAGSLVSLDDSYYNVVTLTRMETVLGQIVLGSNVTESSGNTASQDINWPYAQTAQETLVKQLVRMMQHRIDFGTGTTNMASFTLPTGYNSTYLSGFGDARTLIKENKEFIKDEIAAYIDITVPGLKYSRTICKRDVGYIVDAVIYDLTYGGYTQILNAGLAYFDGPGSTLLIDSSETTATISAYNRLATILNQIAQNTTVTKSTGNTATQWTNAALIGGSSASSFISVGIAIITAILTAGATTGRPSLTVTSITGTNTLNTTAAHGLAAGDLIVPRTTAYGLTADTRYYVLSSGLTSTAFQVSTSYAGSVTGSLTNGSGLTYVVDYEDRPPATNAVTTTTALITAYTTLSAAVGTIVTNMTSFITTNYPTLVYNSSKCQRDARIILDAVGYDFMFNTNFQTIKAAYSYLRASASDVFDGGQKAATRAAFAYVKTQAKSNVGGDATAQARIETLMTTLDDIIFGATTEGLTCSQDQANTDYAILQIERNRSYITSEITAYMNSTFTTTVTNANSTTEEFTCASTSWMVRNAAIRFSGTLFGGVATGTTYYIQNIVSSTAFTISSTRGSNTPFNIGTGVSGSMTVSLYYDQALCLRDVNSYLDAIKYDLKFTGNYKCHLAARYYYNAVRGSLEEDMYYVRNATGIRNQTLDGLTGDILAPNAYGTSRVSAGAYVSLDPGFGPTDYHTWIISRSPYVQNVTTFGTAAIGQKIDGSLHNGGNDSIVSNDFTQVISDGIGAWVTNNARAELVSVFTYYSHIGYLAENGGRIRGTNGNNSYGDFGSVAEGFDNTETPITAIVDNRAYEVAVGSVFTDRINQIWQFEFDNAGIDYTTVEWTISGSGASVDVEQDEFRDAGVNQVRLLDNVDDSAAAPEASGNFGGFGYVSNANTAQGGTATAITIAATDSEISSAYPGMKVYITGGTGAGQYGIISTYNSGTKIANVYKETLNIVGSASLSAAQVVRIEVVGSTNWNTVAGTTGVTYNQFDVLTVSTSSAGTGTAMVLSAGWDHVVRGTTISSPDASTTYVIEPRLTFTGPGGSTNSQATLGTSSTTLAGSYTWGDVIWAPTSNVYSSITGTTSGSGSGATFTIARKGTKYTSITATAGGVNYARLDTITIAGTSVGGASTANNITITVTAINATTGAITAFESVGAGRGGQFVAISQGDTRTNTTTDGTNWTTLNNLPASLTYSCMASGDVTPIEVAGSFTIGRAYIIVQINSTLFTSIGAATNTVGTYFVATGIGTTPTGTPGTARPVLKRLVAVASGSTSANAYSDDGGTTWTSGGALPGAAGSWTGVAYGIHNNDGRWIAVKSGTTAAAYSTNGGASWTLAGALPSTASWTGITYGKGKFVVVASGGTSAAYSSDGGATWTASTLPSSSNWSSVAYGNNRFVAVSSTTGTVAAYSLDGITWTASTLSTSAAWAKIRYGQGVFLAVATDTNNASSSEDGINWTTRALSHAGTGFRSVAHGNPTQTGFWVAVHDGATTNTATRATLGKTAQARAYVADEKIFAIRLLDPGSDYTSSAPTLVISDPSNVYEAPTTVRTGNGAVANPSFVNRGTGYAAATADLDTGDGYADNFQSGSYIAVKRLTDTPQAGANVVFATQPNTVYKLVQVLSLTGSYDGAKNAFLQISPEMSVYNSPAHATAVTTRIRYSQVRLTGHDFLDIGTGNFVESNYPNTPTQNPSQANETVDNNGGRVFYTSTDQDGNFRVGELFTIEQSTGVATLNADAFNIAGLSELTLGNITLGGNSATITEFSTDPFFTADSDSVVPTQRAIKSYIAAQIGGGGASLNVNSVVAGFIEISGQQITTTSGATIQMKATFNFQAGVKGYPLAWNYFLT